MRNIYNWIWSECGRVARAVAVLFALFYHSMGELSLSGEVARPTWHSSTKPREWRCNLWVIMRWGILNFLRMFLCEFRLLIPFAPCDESHTGRGMEQCYQAHSKVSKVVVWVYMDQTPPVVLPPLLPPFPALGYSFVKCSPRIYWLTWCLPGHISLASAVCLLSTWLLCARTQPPGRGKM